MRNRSPARGFTLIEMLIAISLLGVMVVLLFASLRTAAESWNKGEDKISQVNKKAVVYQFFKRHLQTAKPLPPFSNTQIQTGQQQDITELQLLEFQGLPQSIRFVSALPTASARKGLQIFHIGLDTQYPTLLKVALSPYRQTDNEPANDEPTTLLENLSDFKISYFGDNGEGGNGWQNQWQSNEHMPKLVRVHIALQDGSFWPDMIFSLKITGQANGGILGDQNPDQTVPSIDNN